jgi:acetyl-CoA carboxylase beta subunit
MKKQAYVTAMMILLVTVMGVSSASGQTSGGTQMTASIPFDFQVGNKTLPAGDYIVRCINMASDQRALQLLARDGGARVTVQTNSVMGKASDSARLIFNRYGEHYFFAQAWLPGDTTGMRAPKSSYEKRIARELATSPLSRESVAITARR